MIEMLSDLIFYNISNRTANFKTKPEPSLHIFFSSTAFFIISEGYHYFIFIFNEGIRLMKLKISDS